MKIVPDVKSFARNPVTYAKREPVAAGVLVFAGLTALAAARMKVQPNTRTMTAYAIAAAVFVAVATMAPEQVGWVVLVAMLVLTFQNVDSLTRLVDQGQSRIRRVA